MAVRGWFTNERLPFWTGLSCLHFKTTAVQHRSRNRPRMFAQRTFGRHLHSSMWWQARGPSPIRAKPEPGQNQVKMRAERGPRPKALGADAAPE